MNELIGIVTPDDTYNLSGQVSGESTLSGIVTGGAQYEAYAGSYSVTPSGSVQTLQTDGKLMTDDVTVGSIPSDYIGTDIPRRSEITVSQDNNTIHVEDGYYANDIDTAMGACTVTGASVAIDSQGDATGSIIVGRGGYINSGSHAFYVDDVVTPRSSSDLTASGATISVPYGYYSADASKTVASGSAGTPTATKGSVSNHAVNVTPSVTNTTGYITGGTVTGTAVSVSASELVSGNKAITENGTGIDVANYSTVSVDVQGGGSPAISVVDTTDSGGGTVRTITALDISDTTATASDVASGKYFYTAAGTKTQGTASGGERIEAPYKDVEFIDYDGFRLYSYTPAEFLALDAMPPNPEHDGLIAQGWNWTLQDAKTKVQKDGELIAGQLYTTDDGCTRFYILLTMPTTVTLYHKTSATSTYAIDWGDGTTETTTGGNGSISHSYSTVGDLVISINVTGTLQLSGQNNQRGCIVPDFVLKKIEVGENTTFEGYSLSKLPVLETCTNSLTSMPNPSNKTGDGCYRLSAFVCYPKNPLSYSFTSTGLRVVSLANSNENLDAAFNQSNNIYRIVLPIGLQRVSSNGPRYCYAVQKMVIPDTVNYLYATAFNGFKNCKEYHLKPTTPPQRSGSGAWADLPADCVIYVPYSADHSILNAYQTATNWATMASYMQEEPQ